MNGSIFLFLFISMAATTIGAVPLGLVNLSVVNAAVENDSRGAIQIAHGASVVEIFFALIALLAGSKLSPMFEGNQVVNYFVFAVLLVSGLYFLAKKNFGKTDRKHKKSFGFLKGLLLNIVSIQVLLFWLMTAAVLSSKQLFPETYIEIGLFLVGVWLTKMVILKAYAAFAIKVGNRIRNFSTNINRIMGTVLLIGAVFQLIKI